VVDFIIVDDEAKRSPNIFFGARKKWRLVIGAIGKLRRS
jgi:hypothetical protein